MTRETRRLVRGLAAAVVGDRADAALVRPILQTMLQTAIGDFDRYYQAQHVTQRIADAAILRARTTSGTRGAV